MVVLAICSAPQNPLRMHPHRILNILDVGAGCILGKGKSLCLVCLAGIFEIRIVNVELRIEKRQELEN